MGIFLRIMRLFERVPQSSGDDRAKEAMADIAHDLQTPIAILRGNFEILRRSNAGDAERMLAGRVIETTLDGMARLVRGALDEARLHSPGRALFIRDVSLRSLLCETIEDCSILAQEKEVVLSIKGGSGVLSDELFIRADRERVKEVLLNLISNAFKHTPPGGAVTLGAERAKTVARITVEDTGSGIAPIELPHIFERFYRIRSDAANLAVPGTGLGLHICRAIVEAHGGHIGAKSDPGKGSRFTISLPIAELQPSACGHSAEEIPAAAVSAIINP
jgi:signal transduction histidine kinase